MDISIIIITYNRSKYVETLLSSLNNAIVNFKYRSEIIVIDDSIQEEAKSIYQACLCNSTIYIRSNIRNVSVKRNMGAKISQYPILLFIDSDCEAHPNLLDAHANMYKSNDIGACIGLLEFVGPNTWFWQVISKTPFIKPFEFPLYLEVVSWGPSANFSVRADVFNAVGGFDETFPPQPGGEDVDIGLRITNAGYKIICTTKALVFHTKDTWNHFKLMRERLFNWGKADCYIMERHSKKLKQTFPRFTLIFCIVILMSLLFSIIKKNLVILVSPILWSFIYLITYSFLNCIRSKKKLKDIWQQMLALILILINEFGFFKEIFCKKRFDFIVKEMIYTPVHFEDDWSQKVVEIWSMSISLISLLLYECFI